MIETGASRVSVMHRFACPIATVRRLAVGLAAANALSFALLALMAPAPAQAQLTLAQFSYDRSKSQTDSSQSNDAAPVADDASAAEAMELANQPVADDAPLPVAFQEVGVDEKLGEQVPLDTQFFDTSGRLRPLSDYFKDGKPVVLQLGYYNCPQLCGQVEQGILQMIDEVGLVPGRDFEMISLSFDPDEPFQLANQHKRNMLSMADNGAALADGWHFLTGKRKNIQAITEAVGFKFKWNERAQQYAHVAALVVLTPDGEVSRYLYGVRFQPTTVRYSIVEVAGRGDIGTATDRFLMFCFQYDPDTGSYTATAYTIMRLAAAVMVVVIGSTLFMLFAFERRRSRDMHAAGGDPDPSQDAAPDQPSHQHHDDTQTPRA